MGGSEFPDNPVGSPIAIPGNIPFDLDDDGVTNEEDSFMNASEDLVATWNCPSLSNPNPVN